jgi:type II secretory pathway component PulK
MRNDGVALIMALFAVIIVTALVVTFAAVARTGVLLAGNRVAMTQARYAAESSLNYCRTVLTEDDAAWDSTDEDWGLVADEPPALDIPGFTVGAVIEDESAKLNINTATRDMLLLLPGMTEEAADSILDWRDTDEAARAQGAESEYYGGLATPYEAANGPFQTVEELRLVRGVDAALFEGDGTDVSPGLRNLVTVRSGELAVDENGQARLNITNAGAGQIIGRVRDLLTGQEVAALQRRLEQGPIRTLADLLAVPGVSWQHVAMTLEQLRTNNNAFVEGTVNLNTASAEVLVAIGLPAETAAAVVAAREGEPFTNKGALAEMEGMTRQVMIAVAERVAVKSSVFRVRAYADGTDRPVHVGVVAILDRSPATGSAGSTGGTATTTTGPRLIFQRDDFEPVTTATGQE